MHADPVGGLGLLVASQRCHVGAGDAGVAAPGVAVGDQAVDDVDPGVGPARHGPGGAEVHVVGMRDDDEYSADLSVVKHDHDLRAPAPGPRTLLAGRRRGAPGSGPHPIRAGGVEARFRAPTLTRATSRGWNIG